MSTVLKRIPADEAPEGVWCMAYVKPCEEPEYGPDVGKYTPVSGRRPAVKIGGEWFMLEERTNDLINFSAHCGMTQLVETSFMPLQFMTSYWPWEVIVLPEDVVALMKKGVRV